MDVRKKRGADEGRDRRLMIADFIFKILAATKNTETRSKKYNVQKFQMPNVREESDVWLTVHRNSVWIRKTN